MPIVTATPRGMSTGESVTEFLDTVGTSLTTYTFQNTQEKLRVSNESGGGIQVIVNGITATLLSTEAKEFYGSISSFSIVSTSGVQSFRAVATDYKIEQTQTRLTGTSVNDIYSIPVRQVKRPNPPFMQYTLTPGSTIQFRAPKWMDKQGFLYGMQFSDGLQVFKGSTQYKWDAWTNVGTPVPATVGDRHEALLVTDSGRVIVCMQSGEVYVSDPAQTTFTKAFEFTKGWCSQQFGHESYLNIVILCSYGLNAERGANEVYLSTDSGTTWKKIFTGTIIGDPLMYHLHDVCYDPYRNRIWLAVGDNNNANIFYTDDYGGSWKSVSQANDQFLQVTQIAAFEHGVVFGTDTAPDGLRYWPAPQDKFRPSAMRGDVVNLKLLDDISGLRYFATRRWHVREKNFQMCLIPWIRSNTDGYGGGFIHASIDGLNWFEILRLPSSGADVSSEGFRNIVGPHPSDPEKNVYGWVNYKDVGATQTTFLFNGKLPDWI